MSDGILDARIKELRSSREESRASSLRFSVLILLLVLILMLGGLIGSSYIFKLMEHDDFPYAQCEFIKLDDVRSSRDLLDNSNKKSSLLDDEIITTQQPIPIITISLVNADNNKQLDTKNKTATTMIDNEIMNEARKDHLELLSSDNLVKLSLKGYFILHDIALNDRYKLNMGTEGILTHKLNDLVPTIEITFKCGKLTMYLNQDDEQVYYVTMITGELANGHLTHNRSCFLWRTRASGLLFPNYCQSDDQNHYYCDKLVQFNNIFVYHEDKSFKLELNIEMIELELDRRPTSPLDRFITRQGKPCQTVASDGTIPNDNLSDNIAAASAL